MKLNQSIAIASWYMKTLLKLSPTASIISTTTGGWASLTARPAITNVIVKRHVLTWVMLQWILEWIFWAYFSVAMDVLITSATGKMFIWSTIVLFRNLPTSLITSFIREWTSFVTWPPVTDFVSKVVIWCIGHTWYLVILMNSSWHSWLVMYKFIRTLLSWRNCWAKMTWSLVTRNWRRWISIRWVVLAGRDVVKTYWGICCRWFGRYMTVTVIVVTTWFSIAKGSVSKLVWQNQWIHLQKNLLNLILPHAY